MTPYKPTFREGPQSPEGVTPTLLPQPEPVNAPRRWPSVPAPPGNPKPGFFGTRTAPLTQAPGPTAPQGVSAIAGPTAPTGTTAPLTSAPGPTAPPQSTANNAGSIGSQIMSPAPYNAAVATGGDFLKAIPVGNPLASASSAFSGMPGFSAQFQQLGGDLRNQAGLQFARQAGVEVPQMILSQLMGLRGLENDTLNLENTVLENQVQGSLGQILPILKLLGAFSGGLI